MRRIAERTILLGLLCLVALASSGCFLKVVLGAAVVESLNEELDIIITSFSSNATAAVCRPNELTGLLECTYTIEDPEGILSNQTSTTQLINAFGLLGALIDPLVLQVPEGVITASGTVDDPADANPAEPLVVSTVTSFEAQPGVVIVPEPGHVFIIVDFPASVRSALALVPFTTFDFTFQFQLLAPKGQFAGGVPVKPMFTGRVEANGQVYYPPLLPCATSFASLPTITVPIGAFVDLRGQIIAALAPALACDEVVYDFAPLSAGSTDHFQCYKDRDSRGSLCRAGSPANAGAACVAEADCGGIEDETAFCVPRGFPKGLQVRLADQFETGLFDVKKPRALCNPAGVDGGAIGDPLTHLRGYQIAPAKGEPAHARRAGIRVENRFHPAQGELRVDTVKPDRLLVPTAKSLTGPVEPPAPDALDHFKCYRVKPSKGTKFTPIRDVAIVDQFAQPRLVDVTRPRRLCTPADKNDEGIRDPAGHLMCYQVKAVKQPRQPKHVPVPGIFLANQLARELVDTAKEDEFCVPSTKILP